MHNGWRARSGQLWSGHSKTKRVTDSDKVVGRGRGKPYPHVQIELLLRLNLVSRSEVQKVPRSPGLGKIAGVFGKRVPSLSQLSIHEKGGLAYNPVRAVFGGHVDGQHACRGPVGRERA